MLRLKKLLIILGLVLLLMPLTSCVSRQQDERERQLQAPTSPNILFPAFPELPESAFLYDKEYDLWCIPGSYLKALAEYEALISAEEDKYLYWEELYER